MEGSRLDDLPVLLEAAESVGGEDLRAKAEKGSLYIFLKKCSRQDYLPQTISITNHKLYMRGHPFLKNIPLP